MNGRVTTMGKTIYNNFSKQLNQCGTSCNIIKCWKWDIGHLMTWQFHTQAKYAVLILNRPIAQNHEYIVSLWNNALVRVTVDGGTNKWDKFLSELPQNIQNSTKLPDLITGDFDSITEDTMQKYKKCCKVKPVNLILNVGRVLTDCHSTTEYHSKWVVHTPDQQYTDFTKALMELYTHCQQQHIDLDHVLAVCQGSGRIDQTLGNIQTLFLAKEKLLLGPKTRLYIMTDDAVSWLLCPGDHVISIPEQSRQHKRAWCSLVPVGETCTSITTTGLKWNLDNQPLRFGDLVSTSNTFDGSDHVTVKCTNTVLWSMKVPSLLSS